MESKCQDETLRMRVINLNLCILCMFEDTFSLDVANMVIKIIKNNYCKLHVFGLEQLNSCFIRLGCRNIYLHMPLHNFETLKPQITVVASVSRQIL